MELLPTLVLKYMISFLKIEDQCKIRQVSTRFKRLSKCVCTPTHIAWIDEDGNFRVTDRITNITIHITYYINENIEYSLKAKYIGVLIDNKLVIENDKHMIMAFDFTNKEINSTSVTVPNISKEANNGVDKYYLMVYEGHSQESIFRYQDNFRIIPSDHEFQGLDVLTLHSKIIKKHIYPNYSRTNHHVIHM